MHAYAQTTRSSLCVTARSLLRLYPRAWRERYGDEIAQLLEAQPMTVWAAIDLVSGAIDARLSSASRVSRQSAGEGAVVINALRRSCARRSYPFTLRDGLVGAAVFVVGTALFAALGSLLRHYGRADLAAYVHAMSLFASLTLSMPVTFLKGQPWRAQVAIVVGTMAILILIALL
jgi:hypothetical protein